MSNDEANDVLKGYAAGTLTVVTESDFLKLLEASGTTVDTLNWFNTTFGGKPEVEIKKFKAAFNNVSHFVITSDFADMFSSEAIEALDTEDALTKKPDDFVSFNETRAFEQNFTKRMQDRGIVVSPSLLRHFIETVENFGSQSLTEEKGLNLKALLEAPIRAKDVNADGILTTTELYGPQPLQVETPQFLATNHTKTNSAQLS